MANRSQLRTERVIGPLENTTLIRTRIDADLSFQEALGRVRDSVLEAHARQELPFDILAARLAKKTVWIQHRSPKLFDLRNAFRRPFKLPDVEVRAFGDVSDTFFFFALSTTYCSGSFSNPSSTSTSHCAPTAMPFPTGSASRSSSVTAGEF